MTAKYTPGPWRRNGADVIAKHPHLDEDRVVCTMASLTDAGLVFSARDANLNLIAAAPDLLAACEMALEDLQVRALDQQPMPGQMVAAEWLRRAIAKARGGA